MTHDVPPHDDGADRTGGSDSDPVGHLPAADMAAGPSSPAPVDHPPTGVDPFRQRVGAPPTAVSGDAVGGGTGPIPSDPVPHNVTPPGPTEASWTQGWEQASGPYSGPYPGRSAAPPGSPGHRGYSTGAVDAGGSGGYSSAAPPGAPPFPAGASVGLPVAEAENSRSAHRGPRRTLIAAATVAFALIAGFGGGSLGARLTAGTSTAPAGHTLTQLTTSPVSATLPVPAGGSVEQVAATLLPTVVSILSTSSNSAGEGSGVILSAGGLILTNNHVIDGATSLKVQFNDGTTAAATVVGADPTDDLAVITAGGVSGLTPATLGTSADLKIGQGVVAVGSPLGLSATVTSGIVSALNRPVRTSSDQQRQPQQQQLPGQGTSQDTVINAIQTDAAINPGNSGGPLVDMSGQVIGINSAIASLSSTAGGQGGSIGVGFAIPIDQAKRIAQQIIDTGHATHAVLGASVSDATDGANSLLTVGAKIGEITAGGGAEKAGLKAGDVITKVGDQHVDSEDALVAAVRSAAPNGTVTITYTRGTASDTATVTLGSATAK